MRGEWVPRPGPDGGRGGTPRYLPPAKVGTPSPTVKVGTPPPVRSGRREGVPQGTYTPGQGRYSPSQGRSPPGIGQHMEYLIHCGRYASCVHAGGLSCSIIILHLAETHFRKLKHFVNKVVKYWFFTTGQNCGHGNTYTRRSHTIYYNFNLKHSDHPSDSSKTP